MQSSLKVLAIYDAVVDGSWKYLKLIKIDFAMVVNDEHLSTINADDGIGSKVSFVSFAED